MKYGRALRIARFALTIAIIAILVVPLVASIANTNAKEINVGVESRYDLNSFSLSETIDEGIIKLNLSQIKGGFDGVKIDDLDIYPVSDKDAAADYIYQNKLSHSTAVIYKDGNVCTQQTIQYHSGFKTTVVTGMKVPDAVSGLASFDVSMALVGKDVEFAVPYGDSRIENGYLIITTEISDLLNILCNAVDHDMEFKVRVTILAVANFVVDIDVLTKAAGHSKSGYNFVFQNATVGTANEVKIGSNITYRNESMNVALSSSLTDIPISSQIELLSGGGGKITLDDGVSTSEIGSDEVKCIIKILEYLEAQP